MPKGWGQKFDYNNQSPRKAMSAYSFYVQDWYRYWRRIIRSRNPTRVIREVSKQWKRLEEKEKKKYFDFASADKIRAKQEKMRYYILLDKGILPLPPFRPRITQQTGFPRSTKNAYVHFSNDIRNKIRKENPGMPYVEVMREMAKRWKKMSDEEKKPYKTRKEADKNRYRQAKIEFRNRKKEKKRKERYEQGRLRLNRIFNRQVPEPAVDSTADQPPAAAAT